MSPVADAVKQLLVAQGATGRLSETAARASASSVAQLHSKVMAPARILAPSDIGTTGLPLLITTKQREALARASRGTITWLTRALDQQHITGAMAVRQACELLCALSDVVFAVLAVKESIGMTPGTTTSSSTTITSGPRGYDASVFMRLDGAEGTLQALASAAKQLNRHVFLPAASAPHQLVITACLCCDRMSQLLQSLWWQLLPGRGAQARDWSQSLRLTDWCSRAGLLSELAEAMLLVLGMDPDPWEQEESDGSMGLKQSVLAATSVARRLQFILAESSQIYQEAGMASLSSPAECVAQQGTGSDGTNPAPFLRLSLLLLAMAQHWRRAAALPPGSVPNQPKGSSRDIAALKQAIQQQVTPSCCSQMLQQLAPSYWVTTECEIPPQQLRRVMTGDADDLVSGEVDRALMAVQHMCMVPASAARPAYAIGPQELQLMLECAELYQVPPALQGRRNPVSQWINMTCALAACPYPALVEFNTRHGRKLLTLAERSLEAALAAGAAAASSEGGSSTTGVEAANRRQHHMEVAAQQFSCISQALSGGPRGSVFAAGTDTYEAAGYPADATWALLDPSTAPRLLRLMEALVRIPGGGEHNMDLLRALPTHLPEMALVYSNPTTARATLSDVTSITKWLKARTLALEVLLQHAGEGQAAAVAAATAYVRAAGPGAAGRALADSLATPMSVAYETIKNATRLAIFALQSLVRPAVLLDAEALHGAAAAGVAATAAAPASRHSRVWVVERDVLNNPWNRALWIGEHDPAVSAYKAQVLGNPQRMAAILEQLQQGVGAQQRAAAARQAAKLAKKQGGDVSALTEQLQALQVGASSSSSSSMSSSSNAGAGIISMLLGQAVFGDAGADASSIGGSASAAASAAGNYAAGTAGGVPPVTPGDITVAANALLVACKAAGALQGAPQLLKQVLPAAHAWAGAEWASGLHVAERKCDELADAVQEVAEWAVLLHPLLMQLLPVEQGQVLADLRGRLVGGGGSRSNGSNNSGGGQTGVRPARHQQGQGGRGSRKLLSGEEVAAVLGALQHVVIPGQPGCSNPRCCCLEGLSEAEMKTQVCAGCRGVRYCSAACQRAHWRAGHKEVCKAAQAAATAAAAGAGAP